MKEFTDGEGTSWMAAVEREDGPDYKGRYHMVLRPVDGSSGPVELVDVRWNSERTAHRTVNTMSVMELRRRLRSARGRAPSL